MIKVILVRHGETDWNRLRRIQGGGSNTLLNERGRKQVEYLAQRLREEELQAVYSSPLERALVTARAIAAHHQLEVSIEPSLREIDAGELEGVPVTRMGKHLSQILTMSSQGEAFPRIPGGESLPDVQERAWDTIKRMVSKHPEGTLLVVSHYVVILTIICAALKLPLAQIGRFRLGTGSISAIEFGDELIRLITFNECYHQHDRKSL